VALVLLLGLAGCGEPPEAFTQVRVDLRYPFVDRDSGRCVGALEYADVQAEMPVTFRDADDKVIGAAAVSDPMDQSGSMESVWTG